MSQFFNNFWKNESGVTSVEYALLAASAAVVLSVAGGSIYSKVSTAFNNISFSGDAVDPDTPG